MELAVSDTCHCFLSYI